MSGREGEARLNTSLQIRWKPRLYIASRYSKRPNSETKSSRQVMSGRERVKSAIMAMNHGRSTSCREMKAPRKQIQVSRGQYPLLSNSSGSGSGLVESSEAAAIRADFRLDAKRRYRTELEPCNWVLAFQKMSNAHLNASRNQPACPSIADSPVRRRKWPLRHLL